MEAPSPTCGRILAITDDPSRLAGIGACLEEAGYRLATAPTLHDGLKLAEAQPFQVCLLDSDGVRQLQRAIATGTAGDRAAPEAAVGAPVTLDQLERRHIEAVLADCPTLDAAARTLGIDSSTLYRKRKAYGL
jgi:DNA-binding NtrC family response regulator